MTWTKLGEEFPDEARDLADAEFRTHVEALCWSNRRGLDHMIPKRDLKRFAETADPSAAVTGLLAKGWWQDFGTAWFIGVQFAHWQIEAAVMAKRRADGALRVRRHRLHVAGDHSLCLPKNCEAARVMRDDARYVTRYDTGDPDRIGSDRSTETEGQVQEPPDPAPQPGAGPGSHGAGAPTDSIRGTAGQQGDDPSMRQPELEGAATTKETAR